MKTRPLLLASILAATALVVAALAWSALRAPAGPAEGPAPEMPEILALARAKQFGEALALMDRYSAAHPDEERAHRIMAQLCMDQPQPQPARALESLARMAPKSPRDAAVVKFLEGKAQFQLGRRDLAEARWREALRLDPAVPEAGWALLDLLGVEGRVAEAHDVGMAMFRVETDPRDRVRLLLDIAVLDIESVAREATIPFFEPLVRRNPGDATMATVLGMALIHNVQADEGLAVLAESLRLNPDSAEAWDAWLTALDEAKRSDRVADEFDRLPKPLAGDVRFAKHAGLAAQTRRDWPAAARHFERAFAAEPTRHKILVRLARVLRASGDAAAAEAVEAKLKVFLADMEEVRKATQEALSDPQLAAASRADFQARMAEWRERMGRPDEARAWHELRLKGLPGDIASTAALERLGRLSDNPTDGNRGPPPPQPPAPGPP